MRLELLAGQTKTRRRDGARRYRRRRRQTPPPADERLYRTRHPTPMPTAWHRFRTDPRDRKARARRCRKRHARGSLGSRPTASMVRGRLGRRRTRRIRARDLSAGLAYGTRGARPQPARVRDRPTHAPDRTPWATPPRPSSAAGAASSPARRRPHAGSARSAETLPPIRNRRRPEARRGATRSAARWEVAPGRGRSAASARQGRLSDRTRNGTRYSETGPTHASHARPARGTALGTMDS